MGPTQEKNIRKALWAGKEFRKLKTINVNIQMAVKNGTYTRKNIRKALWAGKEFRELKTIHVNIQMSVSFPRLFQLEFNSPCQTTGFDCL
jgi:serine/threonine-protein kinase RIO1